MLLQSWTEITINAFQTLWQQFIVFLPTLIGAIIVLIIGWIIAIGLERLVIKIVNILRIDALLEKTGLEKGLSRAGLKLDSGKFLGFIVKWFIILVFLMAASDILRLRQVTVFIESILGYIPNLVAAILILLVTVWAAALLEKVVRTGVATTELKKSSGLMAAITKWAVLIFGFVAALSQLGVATVLIQSVVTGLIAMVALAGGLAFGLGGKEEAAEILAKLKKELIE